MLCEDVQHSSPFVNDKKKNPLGKCLLMHLSAFAIQKFSRGEIHCRLVILERDSKMTKATVRFLRSLGLC